MVVLKWWGGRQWGLPPYLAKGFTVPIQAELLNSMLVAREAHTGVFKNRQGRIAVVVKVSQKGTVHYLHLTPTCEIVLEALAADSFLREYNIELYHYPVMRAVRKYASYVRTDGFPVSDEARKVINAILTRQ